jgi:heptose-I-phosphate ethanolaminephosphotransferase
MNFLKKLKQLLPAFFAWPLSLMILYVLICCMLINYPVFDNREFAIYAIWMVALGIPTLFLRQRFWYLLVVIFFFTEGLLNLLHLLVIKGPLSASSIFVMLNTNYDESKDFISLKFSYRLLLVIPYIYLFIKALKHRPAAVLLDKTQKITAGVLALGVGIFFSQDIKHNRFLRKSCPQTIKALGSFVEENKSYKALKNRKLQKTTANIAPQAEGRVFVLVIGESASRNHMSLYGGKVETNPLLAKRQDIVVYNNVVAPFSTTLQCVLSLFTESNLENKKKIDQSLSLLDVFDSAGFETFWLSNQSPIGVYDNAIYSIAQTAKHKSFVNYASSSSFESLNTISYDENLLAPINKALAHTAKNKFIVVHLMGNHFEYAKRYPSKFEKYRNNASKETRTVAEYHNAMLYNDYILNHIFDQLKQSASQHPGQDYSAIYLSDHAENVYDYNHEVGHDYVGSLPKENVEIPFVLWLSDSYKKHYPGFAQQAMNGKNLPFVSDDLFHAALDLNQITGPAILPQRSLFNTKYNHQRQRILEDKQDYDQKKLKQKP